MTKSTMRRPLITLVAVFLLISGLAFGLYVLRLDGLIREKFDGKRWSLPAVVYARPLELYAGLAFSPQMLEDELQLAGYRKDSDDSSPGGYSRQGDTIHVVSRDFQYPSGPEKSERMTVRFAADRVQTIERTGTAEPLDLIRIDPARIGSFHPVEHEDRLLLQRVELPDLLIKTLLVVEDQHFFEHRGVSPSSILRALLANLRAGSTVQGGSTLSQQLVKNFYLSNERTLLRKVNEAIMALLLELHYSKDEILTAYANEIFLGQDGGRAVHGFGLASQFYFRRDLADLSAEQIALLVGIIKGPTFFDPRKKPDDCLARRNLVLGIMHSHGIINEAEHRQATAAPLIRTGQIMSGFNRFPAFLDLIKRQLRQDYREEDLQSEGLKILTTLDPQVQWQVERHLARTLTELEKQAGRSQLEGAVVVTNRENGEILALAGGRQATAGGFNRAIEARRPIGSLIKPAVYLTALGQGYTLASPLEDRAIVLKEKGAKTWRPENYDKKEHGRVPLYLALANSYNLATINLGLRLGVDKVIATAAALGLPDKPEPYPSFLLGTAEMSPLEVSQMYQTLASDGFFIPQRAINSVLATDNSLLKRFGLSVEQRFPAETIFLLNTALQRAISEGTAHSLSRYLPVATAVAGKTGTTDNLRDSWFAGFSGDRLAVVWVGRDDNKPAGVTGSSGALPVWGEIMRALHPQPLALQQPPNIEWVKIDKQTLAAPGLFGSDSTLLPFLAGTGPGRETILPYLDTEKIEKKAQGVLNTVRGWFE